MYSRLRTSALDRVHNKDIGLGTTNTTDQGGAQNNFSLSTGKEGLKLINQSYSPKPLI